MPFHDSGKTRKPFPYEKYFDTPFFTKVCLHCGMRRGEHFDGKTTECPVGVGYYVPK